MIEPHAYRKTFVDHVQQYRQRAGISPTRFGRDAVGDPNFVADMLAGRNLTIETMQRVVEYIRDN